MNKQPKYWFKRKRYGYGWVPVAWQGWAVVAGHIGLSVLAALYLLGDIEDQDEELDQIILFLLVLALLLATTMSFVRRKGPPARWRWGKQEDDSPEEDF